MADVISAAVLGNEQVRALVYLNGWMCDVGGASSSSSRSPGSLVGQLTGGCSNAGESLWLAFGS